MKILSPKNLNSYMRAWIILICMVCSALNSFAAKEKVTSTTLYGTSISSSMKLVVEDQYYYNGAPAGVLSVGSTSIVTLGINHNAATFFVSKLSVTCSLKVTCYDINKNILGFTNSNIVPVTITYDAANGVSKDKQIVVMPGTYHLEVEMVGNPVVMVNTVTQPDVPSYVFLNASIEVERYYPFNYTSVPFIANSTPSHQLIPVNNELEIFWDYIYGAEEYELEYTYVDDYSDVLNTALTTDKLNFDFRFNATRINTSMQSYRVPLIYARGWLLYRVRGVTKTGTGNALAVPGKWSSGSVGETGVLNSFPSANSFYINNTGSQTVIKENLNWQLSSSFAEDGKRKDVVSYFDGALYNRQTLTKNNTDQTIIVGETLYDYQGRPAVQVLPVPVTGSSVSIDNSLRYITNFNNNLASVKYSRKDFDQDVSCTATTPPMATGSGASNYYSASNPNASVAENQYIPDAKGYPFSQVEYEPDNTGRVRRQSGVGDAHKLGSNHETQYFYSNPEQEQLDRLFGSEAAYNVHYKKNAVIDANGQVSVSYMDQYGRVVATALAGQTPSNVIELPSAASAAYPLTINQIQSCPENTPDCTTPLADNNKLVDHTLIFSKELLVTSAGDYVFHYDMRGQDFSILCDDQDLASSLCYDCAYDLLFTIKDPCGNIVKSITSHIGSLDKPDPLLNRPATFGTCVDDRDAEDFTVTLAVGTYTVAKSLQVNEEQFNDQLDHYVEHCLELSPDDIDAEVERIRPSVQSECEETSCAQCLTSLLYNENLTMEINYNNFNAANVSEPDKQFSSLEEYQTEVESCKEDCEPVTPCQSAFGMMSTDMRPNGQYGSTSSDDAENWPVSIYNTDNLLPRNTSGYFTRKEGNFRLPYDGIQYPADPNHYRDENGFIAYVPLEKISDTDFDPAVLSGWTSSVVRILPDDDGNPIILTSDTDPNYNNDNAFWGIEPQYLANLSDFSEAFQPSWGDALVFAHPEFCYYEHCLVNDIRGTNNIPYSSYDYDVRLQELETVDDATTVQTVYVGTTTTANPLYDSKFPAAFISMSNLQNINKLDDLLSNDPYFLAGGNGFSKRAVFLDQLTNYKNQNGISLNIKEFVAVAIRCGNYYHIDGTQIKSICASAFMTGTDFIDDEWAMYTSLYLSEKQKLERKLSDEYCNNKILDNISNNSHSWQEGINNGGYNGCIGNTNYNPFNYHARFFYHSNSFPYWFWAFRAAFDQPCSWYTYRLYTGKTKRFTSDDQLGGDLQGMCDVADLQEQVNEMKEKADLEMYMKTGQCPLSSDLEAFLNELAQNEKLSVTEPINRNYNSFTQALYDQVNFGQPNTTATSFNNYTWSPTASALNIIGTLVPQSPRDGAYCNQVTLNFPSGINYDVEDDNGNAVLSLPINFNLQTQSNYTPNITTLNGLRYLYSSGGIQYFTIEANIEVLNYNPGALINGLPVSVGDLNVQLTGSTCLPLNNCDFSQVCPLTPEANDLQNLLSSVAANIQLNQSTPADLTDFSEVIKTGTPFDPTASTIDTYDPLVTSNIKKYLGNNTNDQWSFTSSSTTDASNIAVNVLTSLGSDLRMTVLLSNPVPNNVVQDPNNLFSFSCIKKNGDNPNFLITALYTTDPVNHPEDFVPVQYTGTVTFTPNATPGAIFQVVQCGPPVPQDCKSPAHDNARNIEPFLQGLAGTNGANSASVFVSNNDAFSLTTNQSFMTYLQPSLGSGSYSWTGVIVKDAAGNPNDNGNVMTASICKVLSSGCSGDACTMTLSFVNQPSGIEFSNLVDFTDFTPDYTGVDPGEKTTKFTILAIYKVGSNYFTTLLTGNSCFELATCEEDCRSGSNNQVVNGDFSNPALTTTSNGTDGYGYSSNYALALNTPLPGNCSSGAPGQGRLTKDASGVRSCLSGKDHSSGHGYYMMAETEQFTFNDKLWYSSALVEKGKTYIFTAWYRNLNPASSPHGTFNMYIGGNFRNVDNSTSYGTYGQPPASSCIGSVGSPAPSELTNNIEPTLAGNCNQDGCGNACCTALVIGSAPFPTAACGWVPYHVAWTATIDGIVEIGINYSTFAFVAPESFTSFSLAPPTAATSFGIDDISFSKVCEPDLIFPEIIVDQDEPSPCEDFLIDVAIENLLNEVSQEIEEKKQQFRVDYFNKCLSTAENLSYTYTDKEFHYTLYYYDQAGSLVKTIPPAGVEVVTSPTRLATFSHDRLYRTLSVADEPHHTLPSSYQYNSLNQLRQQTTPDGGTSYFWYDVLGRLVVSQNAKQLAISTAQPTPRYSYTLYDALGRITEVGEITKSTSPNTLLTGSQLDNTLFLNWIASGTKAQITRTYYDRKKFTIPGLVQDNYTLRNRVASITYQDADDVNLSAPAYDHATHYDYDIHGNVKLLAQDNPAKISERYKYISYEYDLISGNVNRVNYQAGQPDAFYHQYRYDANNRITRTYTSHDGYAWDQDARYFYYKHGPLARMETGDLKVQGADYAYTIQGWIKGVNSNTLTAMRDIGKDAATGLYAKTGRDGYGYSLGYFDGDYTSISGLSTPNNFLADATGSGLANGRKNLYNGNISQMTTTIVDPLDPLTPLPQGTAYSYDQLNRIKTLSAYRDLNQSTNTWGVNTGIVAADYQSAFSYDANGNILTQLRNGSASKGGIDMDNLDYKYDYIDPSDKTKGLKSNRLLHVNDLSPAATTAYSDDIDDQGTFSATDPSTWNYNYDGIGNLIKDGKECIANIDWTVYGKVKSVTRVPGCLINGLAPSDLEFRYDAGGHRIAKIVKPSGSANTPASWTYTWYTRDAQGNTLAAYDQSTGSNTVEFHLYGSSRLGTQQQVLPVPTGNVNNPNNLPVYSASDPNQMVLSGTGPFNIPNGKTAFVPINTTVSGDVTIGWQTKLVILGTANLTSLPTNGLEIYNAGRLTVPGLTVDNTGKLFNYGTAQFAGTLTDNGLIQNSATMTAFGLQVGGAGVVTNTGELDIEDYSTVTAGGQLNNSGTFYTGDDLTLQGGTVTANTGTITVHNNLYITQGGVLNNTFKVNVSQLTKIDGGGKYQAGNSSLLTTGSMDMSAQLAGPSSGSFGFVKITGTTKTILGWGSITGNINICSPPGFTVDPNNTILTGVSQDCSLSIGSFIATSTYGRELSDKTYEFSNHLGNVLMTASALKVGVDLDNNQVYDYFRGVIKSSTDYYAFGSSMPGRQFSSGSYRYGFNGKEKDGELHDNYDFGDRIYNPNLGRWYSIDKKFMLYPFSSPYAFASNSPITVIDIDGQKWGWFNKIFGGFIGTARLTNSVTYSGLYAEGGVGGSFMGGIIAKGAMGVAGDPKGNLAFIFSYGGFADLFSSLGGPTTGEGMPKGDYAVGAGIGAGFDGGIFHKFTHVNQLSGAARELNFLAGALYGVDVGVSTNDNEDYNGTTASFSPSSLSAGALLSSKKTTSTVWAINEKDIPSIENNLEKAVTEVVKKKLSLTNYAVVSMPREEVSKNKAGEEVHSVFIDIISKNVLTGGTETTSVHIADFVKKDNNYYRTENVKKTEDAPPATK